VHGRGLRIESERFLIAGSAACGSPASRSALPRLTSASKKSGSSATALLSLPIASASRPFIRHATPKIFCAIAEPGYTVAPRSAYP